MKKSPQTATLAILGSILICTVTVAEPCEFGRNEHGMWVSNCYIADFFGEQFSGTIVMPPNVGLPDLTIDDGDYDVNGTIVEIRARSVNRGAVDSIGYEIAAEITVRDGNGYVQDYLIMDRAPGLAAGTRQTSTVGFVSVPDRLSDYDINVAFLVDSLDWRSGGEIRETNETNNLFDDGTCRVYGENPDLSVGPCQ